MNLLIFHLHDMGRYCSPFGYQLPTPSMDRLAKSGTVFRQAHCAAPTCSPSRAAMLTGETAHQSGMTGLLHRGFQLNDPSRHLGYVLGQNGYNTTYAGVQHEFSPDHEIQPYQRKLEAPADAPGNRDEQTAAAVEEYFKESPDEPFYLWVGMFYPHREFIDAHTSPVEIPSVRPPEPFPDTPELRKEMRDYAASISCADSCLGRTLDALEASGKAEETLIILTTDHGIPYPGMKCNLTDGGTGVAFVMSIPGNETTPAECDAMVSHLDLFPTVCDYLDIPAPEWLQGKPLRPLIDGKTDQLHDCLFAEINYHACYEPARSVRTERYKLIKLFGDSRTVMANIDDGEAKKFLMDRGLSRESRRDTVQLYDLDLDPNETCNIADNPLHTATRYQLEARLEEWMRVTEDPLLDDDVPIPRCAQLNRLSDVSPVTDPGNLINHVAE